jgi:glycerophosphoryl diester phosphodiesterase
MFKPFLSLLTALAIISLGACQAESTPPQIMPSELDGWPSLERRLNCLPPTASLVAAHRGTTKGKGLSENSLESLRVHYEAGIRVAEIDVAQLASGEHILFHDGVWEDKSTGQGVVASSRWREVEGYLLRDTEGGFTTDRPPLLTDIFLYARGRLHLEIDFKSSADYAEVIDLIRDYNMEEDVILISYSVGQARKLARLAPEMLISIGVKNPSDIKRHEEVGVAQDKMMAWVGGNENAGLLRFLESADIPILSRKQGQQKRAPDIYVTDHALKSRPFEGVIGLNKNERASYELCLIKTNRN